MEITIQTHVILYIFLCVYRRPKLFCLIDSLSLCGYAQSDVSTHIHVYCLVNVHIIYLLYMYYYYVHFTVSTLCYYYNYIQYIYTIYVEIWTVFFIWGFD